MNNLWKNNFYNDIEENEYYLSELPLDEEDIIIADEQTMIIDAEQFLHGNCQYFALTLAEKYGYDIILWIEYDFDIEKDALVHAFCTINKNNKQYFIDVRGITDDEDLFLNDFGDWENYEGNNYIQLSIVNDAKNILKEIKLDYDNQEYKTLANNIINRYSECYDLNLIE